MLRSVLVVLLVVTAGIATQPAEASSLGQGGKVGAIRWLTGSCTHRVYPSNGVLVTSVPAPYVRGANLRRGKVDRTWVRFKVWWVDVYDNHNTLATTGWSAWRYVRDTRRTTWPGGDSFTGGWRGGYRADVRVEWWNRTRRVGWKAYRVTRYWFYDEYGAGPYGPFSWCAKAQVY